MKKNLLVFFLILIITVFLRFYKLDTYPPSLNWDEISLGYNAYSILKTSRDEWRQFLPISFRAYGDYKLPVYVYVDVPFVAIMGLNEWGVRMPSALAGIGTVLMIFFILKNLTGQIKYALWGMFFAAILPWAVIFSRIALEANLALFFITSSFYAFLLEQKKNYFLIISALLLGLSIFTYNSVRVVVIPITILALFLFRHNLKRKKSSLLALFLFIFFLLTAIPFAVLQDSSARYKWTTIIDEGAINKINALRGSSTLPPFFEKIAYNKITYFISQSIQNYTSHFNFNFLFINGGSNYQYSIPGSGLLYISLLPLFILGLFQILKSRKEWQLFVLGWLLIAPIPAAITRDSPHALRSLLMIPPFLVISVLGIEVVRQKLKSFLVEIILGIFILVLMLQTFQFWQNYNGEYTKNYSWSWQYGYKQAVEFINQNIGDYQKIYITKKYGEPHEFLLFYSHYDPRQYQSNPTLVRYQRSDWFWVDGFDKFVFLNDWEVIEKTKGQSTDWRTKVKRLLITSPGNYPPGSNLLKSINFLDGKRVFDIVEI